MRVFGLIGYPLSHSFSRKYFLEKFKIENITDAEYRNFSISAIKKFPKILKEQENFAGFNVTAPYKEAIIPYLHKLDKSASQINAVNVIKIINQNGVRKLIGYNTDIYGFSRDLQKQINSDVKTALILGTGGAARAVFFALKKMNIKAKFVSRKENAKDNFLIYKDLNQSIISENQLIVNATPLGIFPDIDKKPDIPYRFLTENHFLFDLIYNPPLTQFLSEGKKYGASIQNGLDMLHIQAEKAWEIFNRS